MYRFIASLYIDIYKDKKKHTFRISDKKQTSVNKSKFKNAY